MLHLLTPLQYSARMKEFPFFSSLTDHVWQDFHVPLSILHRGSWRQWKQPVKAWVWNMNPRLFLNSFVSWILRWNIIKGQSWHQPFIICDWFILSRCFQLSCSQFHVWNQVITSLPERQLKYARCKVKCTHFGHDRKVTWLKRLVKWILFLGWPFKTKFPQRTNTF